MAVEVEVEIEVMVEVEVEVKKVDVNVDVGRLRLFVKQGKDWSGLFERGFYMGHGAMQWLSLCLRCCLFV